MRLLSLTLDSPSRADLLAALTAGALCGIDPEFEQVLADRRLAVMPFNVGQIFSPEILKGGHHRVGSILAQAAQRSFLHRLAQGFQLIQVPQAALPAGDFIQQVDHVARPNPARDAFPAGFFWVKRKK